MSWQLEIARDARTELAVLHPRIQVRISRAILSLEKNPFPSGCNKLKSRDGFRIRVGDYRVLCPVETKLKQNVVGGIGHRRAVYRH